MVLQASPNIFQPNLNIAEPMTVPNEDQIRIQEVNPLAQEAIDLQMAIEG